MKPKKIVSGILFLLLAGGIAACTGGKTPTPPTLTPSPTSAPSSTLTASTPPPSPAIPTSGVEQASPVPPTAAPQVTASPTLLPTSVSPSATPPPSPTATEPAPSPTGQPGTPAATNPTSTAIASGVCTEKASFYGDVTIPDNTSVDQGEAFTKTWSIRNEGTCDWNSNYALVFASGENMNGPLSNPMPAIPSGATGEISVNLIAPSRGGTYTSNWEFQNPGGERFGVGSSGNDLIWVQIAVKWFVSNESAPPASSQCGAQENTDDESQVLDLINNARTGQGLNPLELQGQLSAAALGHSMDMACNNFVGHIGTDGLLWYDRVSAQGYANYNSARENIYVGNPDFGGTPQGAFDWWMNSQVHRDNILNSQVNQVGIGYVFNPASTYGGYYTVDFARP
jgi:uncharacterized protein YkwD